MAQLRKQDEVTELRRLLEVNVPVIKMKFSGIDVDLTFASLDLRNIKGEDQLLLDDPIDKTSLDPRCLRSFNGFRDSAKVLTLVPDRLKFQLTLRTIKLWAKMNGIYSNSLGFLGGFSWALLVAKICQDHEDTSPSELIFKFFQVYAK